ncbi:MAG: FAD-binding oxidoreductase [Myxococcaceae bacterium]|nr:MAG: FAD-binding oxidoreductase [Myxococcaceae bacterium]
MLRPVSETDGKALEAALAAWREALGEAHVLLEPEALEAAQTATFATTQRIPAILRPADTAQIQACLRIAQAHGVPVYPVSAGRNWGYGSRVPPGDGSVLLDLGRMNRIVEHDEQLAYLTVEPGVTFRQAHAWLREKDSSTFITTIGGSPDASLVGNALERGDGRGPHADIFQHVCALEVVLPTGEVVHTGHARFPGAHAAPVFRWGLGPVLDGLFSQSSLGVVTRMTFWLARKQPYLREFFCAVNDDAHLWSAVDRLQALALDGTLKGSFFFWNDLKAFSVTQQYPYASVGRRHPGAPARRGPGRRLPPPELRPRAPRRREPLPGRPHGGQPRHDLLAQAHPHATGRGPGPGPLRLHLVLRGPALHRRPREARGGHRGPRPPPLRPGAQPGPPRPLPPLPLPRDGARL